MDRALETFWMRGLQELFPGWIYQYKIYLADTEQPEEVLLQQVYPILETLEYRNAKLLGVIGECAVQRKEIIISTKNPTSDKYYLNTNSDLPFISGYALMTFPIIESEDVKLQTPNGVLQGVVQI